jgi:FkbM family methyltransferase
MLLDNDIIAAYETMLGRSPENQDAIAGWKQSVTNLPDLYRALRSSDEYFNTNSHYGLLHSVSPADVAFLRSFRKRARQSAPDSVTDFVGSRTNVRFVGPIQELAGTVEDIPVPCNFHSKSYEWVGALRAVDEAENFFTMIELGAGWGPWLIACATAAKDKGIGRIHLIGIEGDRTHCQFMHEHFINNGFDPAEHRLVHAVIGAKSGVALFPIVENPENVWGSEPQFFSDVTEAQMLAADEAGEPRFEIVPALTLAEVIADHPVIDLLHIDIQGGEADVLEAGAELLDERVSRVVIGTHGRAIEERLHKLFHRLNWQLESDDPCRFGTNDHGLVLTMDGTQVWKNRRFMKTAPAAEEPEHQSQSE